MNEFLWDARSGRYRAIRSGRFVGRASVRAALEAALSAEERLAMQLAAQLREGTLSLAAWRDAMTELVTNVQLYSGALARGGWAQLTGADLAQLATAVDREVLFLDHFAARLSAGTLPLDGRVANYARQYALAGRETYHALAREVALDVGFTHETNLLHPADHCDECLGAAAAGRVPIGTLPLVGRRRCRRYCQCEVVYS